MLHNLEMPDLPTKAQRAEAVINQIADKVADMMPPMLSALTAPFRQSLTNFDDATVEAVLMQVEEIIAYIDGGGKP